MIDGRMTSKKAKADRIQALEDMKAGKKHFLFASFSLAKEGLDIPRLDRLYLATPKKDYAVVTQSIGRIARMCEGKEQPVCYDYVDQIGFCENQWKRRKPVIGKRGAGLLNDADMIQQRVRGIYNDCWGSYKQYLRIMIWGIQQASN